MASPKMRRNASSTCAWVGGGSLGGGVACAAGVGDGLETGMGFSTLSPEREDGLQPCSRSRMAETRARRTRNGDFARLIMGFPRRDFKPFFFPVLSLNTGKTGAIKSHPFRKARKGWESIRRLQRLQERDELVFLRGAQSTIVVDDVGGFTGVAQDGVIAGEGLQV